MNEKVTTSQFSGDIEDFTNNLGTDALQDGSHLTLNEKKIYSSGKQRENLMGAIGRVQYAFQNKYLLTANFRYDGSSKFGPNNKWGFFQEFLWDGKWTKKILCSHLLT